MIMGYLAFVLLCASLYVFASLTKSKGFEKLDIIRDINKKYVQQGERFDINLIIENKKWLPISFLQITEKFDDGIELVDSKNSEDRENQYKSSLSVLWYQRIRKRYRASINKRGVFYFRSMNVSLGDLLGFSYDQKQINDVREIVVYPRIKSYYKLTVNDKSIMGETIVKRWIYDDPLYIKGIREYNINDRMKDIHWKSSLKMNKLMVKEYDFTAEREIIIIINTQFGVPFYSFVDEELIERSIDAALSIVVDAKNVGIAVGLWTNTQIVSYFHDFKDEVQASGNNYKHILELLARMDSNCKIEFSQYILEKEKSFNKNTVYVIVTAYLNEKDIGMIYQLRHKGCNFKILDTSLNGTVPYIKGIDKVRYSVEGNVNES
ncbi:DUF58 domain-containing protein [Clostridium oryzae]|uniref:DUF58 domain-containing protein n=1 Tax=Clostridium oryzae TaxID=1450648 RepID=A0A1V4IHM8_9CLOT|nr:DUF58 domain-containing protein [Clostridium oryzae]OPJ59324.1 hypothetical protein CLORY_33330 [Clostridium oryzae]